ncbi:hypothetical protein EJB05_06950, partial [Eragrostis curvula]
PIAPSAAVAVRNHCCSRGSEHALVDLATRIEASSIVFLASSSYPTPLSFSHLLGPKGVAKSVSYTAEYPTDELLDKAVNLDNTRWDMDIADGDKEEDAVEQAKDMVDTLSSDPGGSFHYLAAALELNMESYDKNGDVHSQDFYNYLKVVMADELEDDHLNMYPYLEILLRHFPLCLAWSDCGLKVDCFEPHIVLGGKSKNKIWKSKKIPRYKNGSHSDSILGIAWNMEYRNILASARADKTVKIWDVHVGKCVTTLEHHDSKVQAVAWSQFSPETILSGSFDKSVALVSLENGIVQAFDMRRASSSQIPFLVTASTDIMVKLWDISNNQSSCIASLNPNDSRIFSVSFSTDCPFLLAVRGYKGDVTVWDTLTETSVAEKFNKSCRRRGMGGVFRLQKEHNLRD